MDKKAIEKEAIIAEYLLGNSSYLKIGIKYGIDSPLLVFFTNKANPHWSKYSRRRK